MAADDRRRVKVRVNASAKRLIGYVDLPADESSRFSDVLNNSDAYILIREQPYASTPGQAGAQAVLKDSISYIEALEEPTSQKRLLPGTFRTVAAELKEPAVALEGELFVAHGSDIMDVVNDSRRFISLRNVRVLDSVEKYDYLAIGKGQADLIRF